EVVIFFMLSILQYWWLIWLERLLPARPRHRSAHHDQRGKTVEFEEPEGREEAIVKRWIAEGRFLIFDLIGSCLSVASIFELIAFIIIPVHKQIVFQIGAELAYGILFTTLVRTFAIWAVKTDYVQTLMRNMTARSDRENTPSQHQYGNEL
ncbi:hypothetical protein K491DRAFT_597906, partial [Lophiostoma macrostomum CBS 122681]